MVLASVDALSGDEAHNKPRLGPGPGMKVLAPKRRPANGFRKLKKRVLISVDPQKLHYLISSRCGCNADCFDVFRKNEHLWTQWLRLRKLLRSMSKLEQDNHVRDLAWCSRSSATQSFSNVIVQFHAVSVFARWLRGLCHNQGGVGIWAWMSGQSELGAVRCQDMQPWLYEATFYGQIALSKDEGGDFERGSALPF